MRIHARFISIVLAAVFLDQFSKLMVIRYIPKFSSISVIPGIFDFTHLHNPGGAFGFFANQSQILRIVVFIGMAFVAVGLVWWFYKTTPREFMWLRSAYAMIIGGAIGNLIDRIRFGYVVDFLDVYIKKMHWPAFNLADSFITMGMAIVIFHVAFNKVPDN